MYCMYIQCIHTYQYCIVHMRRIHVQLDFYLSSRLNQEAYFVLAAVLYIQARVMCKL